MVPGKDQNVPGHLMLDQIQILAHAVGCPAVPLLSRSLLRGNYPQIMAEIAGKYIPALFKMVHQGL
jgi:hypothetical protein